MRKRKAVFNWSGGKDSAHALWKALQSEEFDIIALLTIINPRTRHSSMHEIPIELLQMQSKSIGIPLHLIEIDPDDPEKTYDIVMKQTALNFKQKGVSCFIFGDISLHDVRSYRIRLLSPLQIEVVEPLWDASSEEIMKAYLATGFKTIVVTITEGFLNESVIGKIIDKKFMDRLPESCDPNGENGEYHTFCFDGPIFQTSIPFSTGTIFKESRIINLADGTRQEYGYIHLSLLPVMGQPACSE